MEISKSNSSARFGPATKHLNQRVLRGGLVRLLCLGAWCTMHIALFTAPPAVGQGSSDDPIRFLRWTVDDMKALGRSAVSPRSLPVAAGLGGSVLLLSQWDQELTEGAIARAMNLGSRPRRILNEAGNVRLVRPMALIFFLGTLASGDERLQDAAFTSFEAIVVANLLTNVIKAATGRARPSHGLGAKSFRPFSGRTSFPSGHATTVFAWTTPWLLYYGNVPSIVLFVVGAGTAFVRMADNFHWFSDVFAGAVIGFGAGYLLSRRHQGKRAGFDLWPVFRMGDAGLSLRLAL